MEVLEETALSNSIEIAKSMLINLSNLTNQEIFITTGLTLKIINKLAKELKK